ncbi:orotate phosphoribosyltransferase [Rhodocaloribacter litoris]|uniref:orotate phosphoribosyltransferase n=1 Tax=Rhodocaloribacter litoris TaxID=2558931 RepID=UPI0014223670|nr:orotate phosphoribosyltransferase [Rhodocaloribacter litoris]QXD15586.1 orotate phosphoribosyltransferase [Rhodocaloribacter litoris]GIV60912.1 MAG: orotate phosphoribosyltransferase [Rhodothermaceae bacterium]
MTNTLTEWARRIAGDLLEIGAVVLAPERPFTWASGLRAPVYCDNRLTLAYPPVRRRIAEGFHTLLQAQGLAPEAVVGTATAGIPHAAWLAERLDLPMAYARAKPKAHGRGNQVEGRIEAGQRVVVVEDLVSTGGSSVAVVEALQAVGADVLAVLAIFSYRLPAAEAAFAAAGVPLFTLTDFDTLLATARARGALAPEAVAVLEAWRQDPERWSNRWSAAR